MTKLMTDFQFTFMMINFECLMLIFSHTDLTDLTDFYSFGVFTVRQGENRCLQRKRIREIREIRVGDKKKAGRMSKYPFRAMI